MQTQAGSELEQVWREHADEIYRFVVRRVGSASIAEDVTSDVFVAVAKVMRDSPGVEIGVGFLYTVARRRIIDTWRRRERQRRIHERYLSAQLAGSGTAEDFADDVPDLSWLDAVPHRQRTAILLRYQSDLTVAETAERMELSYQGAESLLARGRRSARSVLEATPAAA